MQIKLAVKDVVQKCTTEEAIAAFMKHMGSTAGRLVAIDRALLPSAVRLLDLPW